MSTVLSLQVSYPQHLHFIYIPFVVGNEIRSPLNYNEEGPTTPAEKECDQIHDKIQGIFKVNICICLFFNS